LKWWSLERDALNYRALPPYRGAASGRWRHWNRNRNNFNELDSFGVDVNRFLSWLGHGNKEDLGLGLRRFDSSYRSGGDRLRKSNGESESGKIKGEMNV
jgi:hypothetical protein